MTLPLEPCEAWEFPAVFPEPKSLPFQIDFVSARCVRLRLRSRLGAFADRDFWERVTRLAHDRGRRVYIPAAGIGGLDAISAAALGGLAANARMGVKALACTYVLVGPDCFLWFAVWYDGWNNSFNKGYEQAAVGPLTGLLGAALFLAAMLYVPMAWAHLAATGDPRAFFEFGFVRKLIRQRLGAMTLYAAVFSLATSVWWDIGRALTNAVLITVTGRAVLGTLRRAARRAAFDAEVRFDEEPATRHTLAG